MHVPLVLFAAAAAAIVAFWAWLGRPADMPPSPLAAGEKLYCISYSPFRGSQTPLHSSIRIEARQIEEDLARLAPITNCVRTYSVEFGLDQVPAIAGRFGLQVMQGIWLSSQPAKNQWQVDTAIALAKQHPNVIRSIVVGNEVLLRGEMSAIALVDAIRSVKAAVTVPVTYADVWEFWLRYREVYSAVDFVTIHILPYWEDFPIPAAQAAAHVDAIRRRVVAAFPDKEVIIGETGWPSAGRMREGALPSPINQARVLHEVLNTAKAGGYRVNVIEAFDQPWKRALEGTVGGHWGLYDDRTRAPKFVWGAPLSNHPHWLMQALAGVALAALVLLAAWKAARPDGLPLRRWLGVAAVALVAGAPLGLTLAAIPVESLGVGGWLRSIVLGLLAVVAPVLAGAALAREMPIPGFTALLGGPERRVTGALPRGLAAAFIVLCAMAVQVALGLVFDPRYKDFPNAALLAPVMSFLLLTLVVPAEPRERGRAELIAAATLLLSAAYVSLNEGFANWQAQTFAGLLLALAVILFRTAGGRRRG